VGRAGRDGQDAVGLLLAGPGDMALRRRLLERAADGEAPAPEVIEHKWGLFLELMRWVEGGSCRHDAILRYFGDEEETLDGCGRCDECQALDRPDDTRDPAEAALIVRKALSGVARVSGRFGLQVAVKLIRGEADPRLERDGLDRTPTFGNLREHPEPWLTRLVRRCVTAGWVTFSGGDRPVVVLTADGRAVMKGERPVRLLLPSRAARPPREPARREPEGLVAGKKARPRDSEVPGSELDALGQAVFAALRQHRLAVARDEGVPPFVVASDRTLRDLARRRPRTLGTLQEAYGIGAHKAERYGAGLLAAIAGALDAHG
jgi:ATP-dependent DNA helicase RecQ